MTTQHATLEIVPTNNAKHSILLRSGNYEYERRLMTQSYLNSINVQSFHLYFTTNEIINVGDYYLEKTGLGTLIHQMTQKSYNGWHSSKSNKENLNRRCRKIIASTDRDLIIELQNQCDGCKAGLPLEDGIHKDSQTFGIGCTKNRYRIKVPYPSLAFIEKFCKLKGLISEVLVKYHNGKPIVDSHNTISTLRVNSEDFTYNEVDSLLYSAMTDVLETYGDDLSEGEIHHIAEGWTQDNLKRKSHDTK